MALDNTAKRSRPGMGQATKMNTSSPGFDALGNIADRAITGKKFNESSPEFGTLGTVTRGVKDNNTHTGRVKSKKSPAI